MLFFRKIVLVGHSVGAHLVVNLFRDFIPNLPKDEQDLIKGAILIAGIYDVTPLLKTSYNDALKLDEENSRKFSPMFAKIKASKETKFFVYVGDNDSPKFVEQAKEFHEKLLKDGINSKHKLFEGIDHFNIVENLIDENNEITKLILNLLQRDS